MPSLSPLISLIQTQNPVIAFLHVASPILIFLRKSFLSPQVDAFSTLRRCKVMFWDNPTHLERKFVAISLMRVALGIAPHVFLHRIVYGHIKRLGLGLFVAGWWLLTGGLSEPLSVLDHVFHVYIGHEYLGDWDDRDCSRGKKEFRPEQVRTPGR